MTVLLSWCVQKSVVISQIYYDQEHYKVSLNFEFVWNIITGMGAWPYTRRVNRYLWWATSNYLLSVCGSPTNMEYSTHIQTHFNSLFSKRCESNFWSVILKLNIQNSSLGSRCELAFQVNVTFDVNIGSGNVLVPSGNKPLPEPMLTQIYAAICLTSLQWVTSNYLWTCLLVKLMSCA